MKEDLLDKLMKLGVSETEAKVYMALLHKRQLTAMEIHEFTNVPRSKVYEITQKMILRGICIEKLIGRNKKYQAVEPEVALDNLIKEYENDLAAKKELVTEMNKAMKPLYTMGMQNIDTTDYIEVIKDLPSIHERYVSLVRNTKEELVGFVKGPYAHQSSNTKLDEQESAEFKILKRGALVRTLYEYPKEDEMEIQIAHIESCIKAGEHARIYKDVPLKMYIFDTRYVLMALDNVRSTTSPLTMLVIEHPSLAAAAKILFDILWEKADDYTKLKNLIRHGKKK